MLCAQFFLKHLTLMNCCAKATKEQMMERETPKQYFGKETDMEDVQRITGAAAAQQAERNDERFGLYDPRFEHDNCGIGAVANIKGIKSHKTVDQALHIVENLEHRAGKDAEGKTGDG